MTPTSTAEMKNGRNITAWLIFLKNFEPDLVEHDRDGDLQDVPEDDEREVVEDRVPRQQPELAGLEQELEVLEARRTGCRRSRRGS